MGTPREIAPGLFHWSAVHKESGAKGSSYLLARLRVLLDPHLPGANGLRWLERHGPPEHIILTNRLHSRDSARLVEAFGCAVWCKRAGLAHVRRSGLRPKAYDPGDVLPGKIRAVEVGAICPDEAALVIPSVRAAAVADGVIRRGNGPLVFVPDEILVDDPAQAPEVKRKLKQAYRKLARRSFDHLLLAHGPPWLDSGREALRAWAAAPGG